MASLLITDADRGPDGKIRLAEPRSLADLLPPAAAPVDPAIHRSPPTRAETATMIAMGMLLIGLMAYLWASGDRRGAAPPRTPATARANGAGIVTSTPPPATPVPAMLPAFAAPNGLQLGQIEATRMITEVAHYGADWIQAEVQFSGLVWLRASDFPALAIVGADLAPRPTLAPVYVEPPEATPELVQCAEAGIHGKMVTVCGYDSLATLEGQAKAEWIQTYGGNLGALDSPTPQLFRR